ncbi:uncharacterized protein PHALS_04361 [Plasmopara halstedii]|uniref:Uncharacterized protein n=1 Tax=Plasmopara halstedii TaxID=4781 RepID=A0A0P1B0P9_PLAHL|nr:uncharacterized protein PHALS_04361 [Plasmopara halstedii]CEG47490.1 hypothetical protein PHALS_04361 [Plasmopara halstedii]|eukprot:XP_024583859.1 hypothetical protein PHALS_04361 [Plasmopara halstedii]
MEQELNLLIAITARYTETQLVLLVLTIVMVALALLSYFVVAPECEKRLNKKYVAIVHASPELQIRNQKVHNSLHARNGLRKYKSLGAEDVESGAGAGADKVQRYRVHRRFSYLRPSLASVSYGVSEAVLATRQDRNARRRKSESDALKQATIQRADMLRRRLLLRKLEKEIAGTVKANEEARMASNTDAAYQRLSHNTLDLSNDRLKMLQEHPADCVEELTILARAHSSTDMSPFEINTKMTKIKVENVPELHEVKRALNKLHDVLSFYLSVNHRDMNKLTVLCNSLLQFDGLNRLRAFEASRDQDVRALSTSIIEKAVPAIWH